MDSLKSIRAEVADDLEFNRLLKAAAILVVDDEPGMRNFLKRALENRCALLEVAGSAEEAEALRLRFHFDLLLVDIRLPGLSGLDWVARLRERGVRTHVIYMTAYADLEMAISALRNDADDFIMKPFRTEQMFMSMQQTLMRRQILRENSLLRIQLEQMQVNDGVIGESEAMNSMLALVQRIGPTHSSVLVQGETGTGKSLIAKLLHSLSRRSGAFMELNSGTLTHEALERELFGYIKGAFPDAHETRDGLLLHADKGSLFIDEISSLSESVQAKLVVVIESGLFRPLGGNRDIPIDVRIISATTRSMENLRKSASIRPDLFYQLAVMPIQVPPLRDRGRDIELLALYFMDRLSAELRLQSVELLHKDWQELLDYHWPGNVRELRNVVERTLLLGRLPVDCLRAAVSNEKWTEPGYPKNWTMDAVERAHIESVLASVNNNKSAAARLLGLSRKTLERKQTLWHSADRDRSS